MPTGTVHVWSAARGSGWIKPDAGGDRVYVHKSGLGSQESGRGPRLEKGQRVDFEIGQRAGRSAAVNVRPAVDAPAAVTAGDSDEA